MPVNPPAPPPTKAQQTRALVSFRRPMRVHLVTAAVFTAVFGGIAAGEGAAVAGAVLALITGLLLGAAER